MKRFDSLEAVLKSIIIDESIANIIRHGSMEMGEYYHKTYLQALGNQKIVQPYHLNSHASGIEEPCEIYEAKYKGGALLVVLPHKIPEKSKFDDRKVIFQVKNDLIDYFIKSEIGYSGYKGDVIKSLKPFPTQDFDVMADDEARDFVKKFDFSFWRENYDGESEHQRFSGWRKTFENNIVIQIKCDNGSSSSYNPMYFLFVQPKK